VQEYLCANFSLFYFYNGGDAIFCSSIVFYHVVFCTRLPDLIIYPAAILLSSASITVAMLSLDYAAKVRGNND